MRKSEIPPRGFFLAEDSRAPYHEAHRSCNDEFGEKNGYRRARRAQEIGKRTDRDNIEQAGADENVHEGTLHPEGKHDLGAENTVETSQEYRPRQNAHGGCRGREISSEENHGQVRRANEQ